MKTIGLIGGMSWESTASYYRYINEDVKHRLGELNSAKIILSSVNFQEVYEFQHSGRWDSIAALMIAEAKRLEVAGADAILICTNTIHKLYEQIQRSVGVPVIHVADVIGEVARTRQLKCLALTGTKFTMEQDFYRARLKQKFGLETIIPQDDERDMLHSIIFERLCKGIVTKDDVSWFTKLSDRMRSQGADALILGCTELAMLVGASPDEFFMDTTKLHSLAASEFICRN